MEASRELDALVAEKVMGFRFWSEKRGEYTSGVCSEREPWLSTRFEYQAKEKLRYAEVSSGAASAMGFFGDGPKRYSTDIAAAWAVVAKMRELGFLFSALQFETPDWEVEFHAKTQPLLPGSGVVAQGRTCELAICLAALKALGIDPEARP